eukprot:251156_1
MTASVVYVFFEFLKQCKQAFQHPHQFENHIFGVTFMVLTIFAILNSCITISGVCVFELNESIMETASTLCVLFFELQSFMLLIILLNKLQIVFNGTRLSLGRVNKSFHILYLFIIALCNLACVILKGRINATLWKYLFTFCLCQFLVSLLSVVFIFMYKLSQVYRDNDIDKNIFDYQRLVTSITQSTILASLSVLVIAVQIATIFLMQIDICIVDIYTNFLMITMQYKAFQIYYKKWCHWIDSLCRLCWIKLLTQNENHLISIRDEVHSNSNSSPLPILRLHREPTMFTPDDSIPLIVINNIMKT